jgi:hypothetical protein
VDEFVALFPPTKAPYVADRSTSFHFLGRVPSKFAELLPMDPNSVRIGERILVDHDLIAVTLLSTADASVRLHVFSKDGAHQSQALLASVSRVGPYGGESDTMNVLGDTYESTVFADRIEVTRYEGTEQTNYLPERLDGSRPIFNIQCNIRRTTHTDVFKKTGTLSRKDALIKPVRSTADLKGCEGQWPVGTKN